LAKYLKATTFTIKTLIGQTITYGTWNAYPYQNINQSQNQTTKDCLPMQEKVLGNGMDLQKEESGIRNIPSRQGTGKNGRDRQSHANIAASRSSRSLEMETTLADFAMQTAKPLLVESVSELKETADVYDITVPGVGHFSLENGAIVHNSDAFRYMCIALKKASFEGSTPEQLDKRYREAVYGSNQSGFFGEQNQY
jgi:hypothetical protein